MFTFLNPVLLVQGFGQMGKHENCLMFTLNYKMYVLQVYLEITSSQQVFFSLSLRYTKNTGKKKRFVHQTKGKPQPNNIF
jgi:hypothetical protein